MADYVETADDNGGVHINSGIPNRAFALAALDLGGFAWERTGQVWYDTLTAGEVPARSDFVAFARATLRSASRLFPDDPVVAEEDRGGLADGRRARAGCPGPTAGRRGGVPGEPPPAMVAVRRNGGHRRGAQR